MAEWLPLWVFPRDREATGMMYWPATDMGPEEIKFGRVWDHWMTFDRPTHWIPCAEPGSPQSLWLRLQQQWERILNGIWPRDDMTVTFVYYWWDIKFLGGLERLWRFLTKPVRPVVAVDLDDELPF
jgi:hypothetical protein